MSISRALRLIGLGLILAAGLWIGYSRYVTARSRIPTGSLFAEAIVCEFAIYYLPEPISNPDKAFEALFTSTKTEWQRSIAPIRLISKHRMDEVTADNRPPSVETLRYYGRGLTREQAEALQGSKQACVVYFSYPSANVWSALRVVNETVEQVARETGGLIFDGQTREIFSPDAWHKKRLESWSGEIPDISTQITIHAYKNTDYVRAITLGMSKAGLPDVVVEELSWSNNNPVGHLINALCQSMAERGTVSQPGEWLLDLKQIQHPTVRERMLASVLPRATGTAQLTLRFAPLQQGDADNRLLEVRFDRYSGNDAHAQQQACLDSFLGSSQSVARIKHNDELAAASAHAREQLPALHEAFQRGLAPGEAILVKTPFAVPTGGQEWMWVEITSWKGDAIKGLLCSDPLYIPNLHGGQIVEVSEKTIFDFIHRHADGTTSGNETSAIIEKMQSGENSTK